MTRHTTRALPAVLALTVSVSGVSNAQNRTDHWEPVGPTVPVGIHAIAPVPTNSAIVYAATDTGIDVTGDEGGTWSSLSGGLAPGGYSSVTVDPNQFGVVYAVESNGPLFKLVPGQRLSRNWVQLNVTPGGSAVGQNFDRLFVGRDPSATLYLLSQTQGHGLTISHDGGSTWSAYNSGLQGNLAQTIAFDPANSSRVFAITTGPEIFRSDDAGRTWDLVGADGSLIGFATALTVYPHDSTFLVAAGDDGLARSEDGGVSWDAVTFPEPSAVSLAFDAGGDSLFASSPLGNIYVSYDGGTTWSLSYDGGGVARTIQLATSADAPLRIYGGATASPNGLNAGLLVSDDGGSDWSLAPIDNDRVPVGVAYFAISPSDPGTIYAMSNGETLFRTDDSGQSWRAIPCAACVDSEDGALRQILVNPILPNVLYARSQSSVVVSFDSAATWTQSSISANPLLLNELVADVRVPGRLFLATDSGVFRSDDGAMSWTASASNPFPTSITSILLDPTNSEVLYAGGNAYQQPDGSFSSFLFRSIDGGSTWARMSFAFPSGIEVDPLAVDPSNPSVVYAALSSPIACPSGSRRRSAPEDGSQIGQLEKSTDGARTWQATGLTRLTSVSTLALDPENPSALFAYVTSGCFFDEGLLEGSLDGGASWGSAVRGLPGGQVNELRFDPTGRTLYCGSDGGLFVLDRSSDLEPVPPSSISAPTR